MPTEYWHSNCLTSMSFVHRARGRHASRDRSRDVAFGRDYPHTESTWPNTKDWLRGAVRRTCPRTSSASMLGENVIRTLDLDRARLAEVAERDRTDGGRDHARRHPPWIRRSWLTSTSVAGTSGPAEGDAQLSAVGEMVRDDLASPRASAPDRELGPCGRRRSGPERGAQVDQPPDLAGREPARRGARGRCPAPQAATDVADTSGVRTEAVRATPHSGTSRGRVARTRQGRGPAPELRVVPDVLTALDHAGGQPGTLQRRAAVGAVRSAAHPVERRLEHGPELAGLGLGVERVRDPEHVAAAVPVARSSSSSASQAS